MSISFGPKLGLLFNAFIDEAYYDQFRPFMQALDQLIMGSVINATRVSPPSSPNPGDAYLISSAPSGAWVTFPVNSIAVWDTQVTLTGTNTTNPSWVNYIPNAGWTIWNTALAGLYVFSGTSWAAIGGSGANFPTNTDITSMTGIPNTTIDTTGYEYDNGTTTQTTVIGASGYQYGEGAFGTSTAVYIANQAYTGTGYTGLAVVVNGVGGQFSLLGTNIIGTSGTVIGNNVNSLGLATLQALRVGDNSSAVLTSNSANMPLSIGPLTVTTSQTGVVISSGTGPSPITNKGLLGFAANYYTQTTVGAAGGASALPALPSLYLPIDINGTIYVVPLYAH